MPDSSSLLTIPKPAFVAVILAALLFLMGCGDADPKPVEGVQGDGPAPVEEVQSDSTEPTEEAQDDDPELVQGVQGDGEMTGDEEPWQPDIDIFAFGDTVETDRFQVTASAEGIVQGPDTLGMEDEVIFRHVYVEVTIVNLSDAPLDYDYGMFSMQDPDGVLYDSYWDLDHGYLESGTLQPGGKIKGLVPFEAFEGTQPITLILGTMEGNEIRWE